MSIILLLLLMSSCIYALYIITNDIPQTQHSLQFGMVRLCEHWSIFGHKIWTLKQCDNFFFNGYATQKFYITSLVTDITEKQKTDASCSVYY